MSRVTIHVEPFFDWIEEADTAGLFGVHWEDLALERSTIPLKPQWHVYRDRLNRGELSCLVMRDCGRVVGYWVQFIAPGLHYETCLTASMDIFFIHPTHRSGANALRLVHAVEVECRRRGVRYWRAGEKLHKPVGRLFSAIGMSPIETIWAKRLDY